MKNVLTLSSTTIERKLSDLIADVLETRTIAEARMVTLQRYGEWFDLIQGLWVGEPRTFGKVVGEQSLLLHALAPVEQSIVEAQLLFREHNPVLQVMLADPARGPLGPLDVLSRADWNRNPFRAEVNDPLGFTHVVSFQIDEGEASRDAIYMPVLARADKNFSEQEIAWLNLSRVVLQPIFAHIRKAEKLANKIEEVSRDDVELLSPVEAEVFHWMSQGKRNKEIAIILGRSPRTVEKHVQMILRKTHTETRTAAVKRV
ncbi:MAG: LuxR family transcriptional regulator [Verrucomicrobia bacterium]|nr:MAG: LuxR family transcriptional regulator [Verrucomicrobiota bacterium]